MKNFIILILTGAVIFLLVVFFRAGCQAPLENTPHDVAWGAIQSLEGHDINETCSYFTGTAYNQMRSGLESFYLYDDIRVSDVVIDVRSETGSIASVYIEYDISWAFMGYSDSEHIRRYIQCVKLQDERWYINTTI